MPPSANPYTWELPEAALSELGAISEADIEVARADWREKTPQARFRRLLDAEGEEVTSAFSEETQQ